MGVHLSQVGVHLSFWVVSCPWRNFFPPFTLGKPPAGRKFPWSCSPPTAYPHPRNFESCGHINRVGKGANPSFQEPLALSSQLFLSHDTCSRPLCFYCSVWDVFLTHNQGRGGLGSVKPLGHARTLFTSEGMKQHLHNQSRNRHRNSFATIY